MFKPRESEARKWWRNLIADQFYSSCLLLFWQQDRTLPVSLLSLLSTDQIQSDFLEAQTIHYQLAGWLETREEHSWRYGEKEDQARHVAVGLPGGASLERKWMLARELQPAAGQPGPAWINVCLWKRRTGGFHLEKLVGCDLHFLVKTTLSVQRDYVHIENLRIRWCYFKFVDDYV